MMFQNLKYPETRTVDADDHYFGVTVPDAYRWLEDADNSEVQTWTQRQMDFALEHIARLPHRQTLISRLTEVWNFPRYGTPQRRGSRLFFKQNTGLQNQPVVYVQDGDESPRLLLDPNTLSDDGTIALMETQPSKDGQLFIYATSEGGSDWREFRVRDVDTGQDLSDVITRVRLSSVCWMPDKSGFLYTRNNKQDESGQDNQDLYRQLVLHQLGTQQDDDDVVFARPDLPSSILGATISDDGQFIVVIVLFTRTGNRLAYARIADKLEFIPLFDENDAHYEFIGNDTDTFYIKTSHNAPRGRVIAVNINQPETHNWREILPESEDTISECAIINHRLVVAYMRNANHVIRIFSLDGTHERDVALPAIGSVTSDGPLLSGGVDDSDFFVSFMSYLHPPSVLRYDFEQDTLIPFLETKVPSFDAYQYETRQVFYPSKDGTPVSMFITAKKNLELDSQNPTILYGYGGFNVSIMPQYYNWLPVWLERGGVLAVANLRGGNEYGEEWHVGGMLENKQNVFDDFIAGAEWLIDNGFTSTEKLAIEGRSNGGLLVAAVMLQRPDLFGVVLCHVPVIDMLRYQHYTAGRYWTPEYGDANASKSHFDFLHAYSPLHNIMPDVKYPPLLITTADHDDRVVPMHSKKFAAALQAADVGENVILLRIDTKAGHGMGKATDKLIEERADVLAFAGYFLGMD